MELKNSDNLHIYRLVRSVPDDARKPFTSSYGKKLTEIDPMWRIEKLTELFGPAGEGWYTEVVRQESVPFSNGEICIFTDVNLYLKDSRTGKWSKPIRGTGGNRLVIKSSDGLSVDDEAYKKAYTDALGIACKALGFGADIYRGRADSKYLSGTATISSPSDKHTEKAEDSAGEAGHGGDTNEQAAGLPVLSPEHPRWSAFISWAAKKPADKTPEALRNAIRKQWVISDVDFTALMKLAGRVA